MIPFNLAWKSKEGKDKGEKTSYLECKIILGKLLAQMKSVSS